MSLLAELKRRNVIRVAGLYAVAAWLVVQVAETVLPIFETPGWVLKVLVVLLVVGFIPAVIVAWAFELTPQGLRREAGAGGVPGATDPTARKLDIAIIALLVLIVGAMAMQRLFPPARQATPAVQEVASRTPAPAPAAPVPPPATAPAAAAAANDKSIAVLAFADLSPGKDQEYFSDGIAEEILNALAKVPGLRVAGRTSAFHFKGRNEDLRGIGKALGVAHVLEGSVRKQGERVRITAQLVRSEDGFHLWSETYDGELDDVFALQERIARSITAALQLVLSGAQSQRLVHAGTENSEAYGLYLQATSIFNRREGARFAEGVAQLEQAIALDPKFARAHSRLAALHAIRGTYRSADVATAVVAAERHARRASELDPTLAEPHAALGQALGYQRRYGEQRQAFARALQIDPQDVTTQFWHGVNLHTTGYVREGNAALDRALALDPLLPNALLWRARAHVRDGNLDTAERMVRGAYDGGLAFAGLGTAVLEQARGNPAAGVEPLTQALAFFTGDFPPEAPGLFARAALGEVAAKGPALALIDAFLATHPRIIPGVVPFVLFRTGEVERGFALMQDKPTSNDGLSLFDLLSGLIPGPLQSPQFPEFARRMGLAALWDANGPPEQCRKLDNGDYVCQ